VEEIEPDNDDERYAHEPQDYAAHSFSPKSLTVSEEKLRSCAGTSLAGTSGIGGVAPTIGFNTPLTTKFLNSRVALADLDEVIIEEPRGCQPRLLRVRKSGAGERANATPDASVNTRIAAWFPSSHVISAARRTGRKTGAHWVAQAYGC